MQIRKHKLLDIPNHELISAQMYDYICTRTSVLQDKVFWTTLNLKDALENNPELVKVFSEFNVTPMKISIIYAEPNLQGAVHVDNDSPVRILWPIKNCKGSYTRFYNIEKQYYKKEYLPNGVGYIGITKPEPYELVDEIELTKPAVFDPVIPHGVYTNPAITEPRLTMTIEFYESIDHWLLAPVVELADTLR